MFDHPKELGAGGAPGRGWRGVLLTSLQAGALVLAAAGAGGVVAGQGALAAPAEPSLSLLAHTCQPVTTTVSVDGGGSGLTIVGELCWRDTIAGKPLQILTAGHTYDHTYWDFPYQPGTYSYVENATATGHVTLNYDRLGVGGSDLPGGLPESLSVANHADVLHQLVQGARDGTLTGTAFSEVVSVGHSLGSAIAAYEAGAYGDVDALLLTASLAQIQPGFVAVPVHPAVDDPKFAGSGLPEEVLTTVPGAREDFFFFAGTSDPAVIDVDEDLKATGVLHELLTIATAFEPEIAGSIDVPVLFVIGQFDLLFCNTAAGFPCDTEQDILDRQEPLLPNAPCVDAIVIGGAGHDLNLHLNAQATFAALNTYDWQGCPTP